MLVIWLGLRKLLIGWFKDFKTIKIINPHFIRSNIMSSGFPCLMFHFNTFLESC